MPTTSRSDTPIAPHEDYGFFGPGLRHVARLAVPNRR